MGDELLDYWREHGTPPRRCSYKENEDGSVSIENMDGAASLGDFSNLDFFVKPKEPPKLKTTWRKRDIEADRPPPKKSKLEPWRK